MHITDLPEFHTSFLSFPPEPLPVAWPWPKGKHDIHMFPISYSLLQHHLLIEHHAFISLKSAHLDKERAANVCLVPSPTRGKGPES